MMVQHAKDKNPLVGVLGLLGTAFYFLRRYRLQKLRLTAAKGNWFWPSKETSEMNRFLEYSARMRRRSSVGSAMTSDRRPSVMDSLMSRRSSVTESMYRDNESGFSSPLDQSAAPSQNQLNQTYSRRGSVAQTLLQRNLNVGSRRGSLF